MVLQPEAMVAFAFGVSLLAYCSELLVWTKDWWEGSDWAQWLIYKDAVSPGCRLGRYLAPLVLCCMWSGYAVVAAAMRVAENTQRNVRLLPKLADYLPEGADSRIREGILEILKQHSEGKGRRWGVSLCKYHIDLTFWKVASTYLRTMAFALVAVLPTRPFPFLSLGVFLQR